MSKVQLLSGRFSMNSQSVNAGVVDVSPAVSNLDRHVREDAVVCILDGDTQETNIEKEI